MIQISGKNMRRFSSYGSPNKNTEYYVPRKALITHAIKQLKGNEFDKGGHYITVWASRQTGKTWIMQQVVSKIKLEDKFDVVYLSLQFLYEEKDADAVAKFFAEELIEKLNLKKLKIESLKNLHHLFKQKNITKPLILILDEFDALEPTVIAKLVAVFRHIYMTRQNQIDKPTSEKDYLLHGMALIGVRAVLGVENSKGSPFNVQRSLHIPNLTHDEVVSLFDWYQKESQQKIEPAVVERIWYEFQGQPGLTCWFGELLTEKKYNQEINKPITMMLFKGVYAAALNLLPNNNILNIVSKAKQAAYKPYVLKLFATKEKVNFSYDDPIINFLYMNGVVTIDEVSLSEHYVKFPCPYIQKRLFNYFARELYQGVYGLYDPFEDLSDTITNSNINIRRLLQRYEQYLQTNREMILRDAPRRKTDLRVFEAVFHFHFYLYLVSFFQDYEVEIVPEFPTGNGKIDLLIRYTGKLFGVELKSFSTQVGYRKALKQAAKYGNQLGVIEIWLVLFVEVVDDQNRQRFERDYTASNNVIVHPLFVQTGSLL